MKPKKKTKGCTKPTEIDGNCVGPDDRGSSFKSPNGTYYKNCRFKCTNMCPLNTKECINKSWCLSDNDCLETGKVTLIPSKHAKGKNKPPLKTPQKLQRV